MLQMAGAVVAGVLLMATGVTTESLVAVLFTSVASSISVLLFGTRAECSAIGNLGPIWDQNHPNTGQNGGVGPTRKRDESTK
jgi:hypothetical protein